MGRACAGATTYSRIAVGLCLLRRWRMIMAPAALASLSLMPPPFFLPLFCPLPSSFATSSVLLPLLLRSSDYCDPIHGPICRAR